MYTKRATKIDPFLFNEIKAMRHPHSYKSRVAQTENQS